MIPVVPLPVIRVCTCALRANQRLFTNDPRVGARFNVAALIKAPTTEDTSTARFMHALIRRHLAHRMLGCLERHRGALGGSRATRWVSSCPRWALCRRLAHSSSCASGPVLENAGPATERKKALLCGEPTLFSMRQGKQRGWPSTFVSPPCACRERPSRSSVNSSAATAEHAGLLHAAATWLVDRRFRLGHAA